MEQFIETLHNPRPPPPQLNLSLRLMICLAQIVWFTENKEEKQLKFIQNEQKYGIWWRCLYLYACERMRSS